jgi:hypothetical protein
MSIAAIAEPVSQNRAKAIACLRIVTPFFLSGQE